MVINLLVSTMNVFAIVVLISVLSRRLSQCQAISVAGQCADTATPSHIGNDVDRSAKLLVRQHSPAGLIAHSSSRSPPLLPPLAHIVALRPLYLSMSRRTSTMASNSSNSVPQSNDGGQFPTTFRPHGDMWNWYRAGQEKQKMLLSSDHGHFSLVK